MLPEPFFAWVPVCPKGLLAYARRTECPNDSHLGKVQNVPAGAKSVYTDGSRSERGTGSASNVCLEIIEQSRMQKN